MPAGNGCELGTCGWLCSIQSLASLVPRDIMPLSLFYAHVWRMHQPVNRGGCFSTPGASPRHQRFTSWMESCYLCFSLTPAAPLPCVSSVSHHKVVAEGAPAAVRPRCQRRRRRFVAGAASVVVALCMLQLHTTSAQYEAGDPIDVSVVQGIPTILSRLDRRAWSTSVERV